MYNTTIVCIDPLPSLGEVYSRVIREEQRLASARVREHQQDAIGFGARGEPQDFQSVTRGEQADPVAFLGRSANQIGTRTENSILRNRDRSMLCLHCG